jgi:hypothetical protein
MADVNMRVEQAVKELTGNEALLEMLDSDAAAAMLEWGKALVTSVVQQTDGLEDDAAEFELAPRLKAVRQSMRSIGNWAAGKYSDPESRSQLRDKLLEQLKTIHGESASLPAADELDAFLNRVDVQVFTQHQLILDLRDYLNGLR